MAAPPAVAPYDHVRVAEGDDAGAGAGAAGADALSSGVYRVVGADADRVALLEVADASGERVHTGRVERVPRSALDGLDRVDSPDPSGPFAAARTRLEGLALTLRFAPGRVARRPVQTALGVALLAADRFGVSLVPNAPGWLLTAAGVCGVVLLTAAALDRP